MRMVVIGIIAMALSGCGNIKNVLAYSKDYMEPTSGDTARLRIITNGMVRGVPGRDCIDWQVPGAGVMAVRNSGFADKNNGRSLGMPAGSDRADGMVHVRSELKVQANKPLAINFQGFGRVSNGTSYSCQQRFSFTPQANQDYELNLLEDSSCLISLVQLNQDRPATRKPFKDAGFCNALDAL